MNNMNNTECSDNIRQLFYSDNVELALQLIKGGNYDLKDLLKKWIDDEGFNKKGHWIFVGTVNPLNSEEGIMIYFNKKLNYYVVWIFNEDFIYHAGINICIDKLYEYLMNNYG